MEFFKERNIMKKMMRIDLGEEKKKPCPMQFEGMTAFIFKIATAFVKNTKLILKTSTRCSVLVFASKKESPFLSCVLKTSRLTSFFLSGTHTNHTA